MDSTILRRCARRLATLLVATIGAIGLSTSTTSAQSVIQITNYDGTVLPAHAAVYSVYKRCYTNVGGGPQPTICEWYLNRLGAGGGARLVVIHVNGSDPACYAGFTQYIVSGYTRSQCTVYVAASQYGT
jgi:hypothetical protein